MTLTLGSVHAKGLLCTIGQPSLVLIAQVIFLLEHWHTHTKSQTQLTTIPHLGYCRRGMMVTMIMCMVLSSWLKAIARVTKLNWWVNWCQHRQRHQQLYCVEWLNDAGSVLLWWHCKTVLSMTSCFPVMGLAAKWRYSSTAVASLHCDHWSLKAWKVMENNNGHGKVMENDALCSVEF